MAKIAISLDDQLYDDAARLAQKRTDGNFSALVAAALRREVQREVGLELVAEYEADHGPISDADLDATRKRLWPPKG